MMISNFLDRATSAWQGEAEGLLFGSEVSIIFTQMKRAGEGPALHRHPYSETFLIRAGHVEFFNGASRLIAEAGQIVVVAAHTPHSFNGLSDWVEMIDIHASPRFITEWL